MMISMSPIHVLWSISSFITFDWAFSDFDGHCGGEMVRVGWLILFAKFGESFGFCQDFGNDKQC